jgi:hypothetical protein
MVALFAEEVYPPSLGQAPCEQSLGLRQVSGAGAFTNAFTVEDFVDVPYGTA